MSLDKAKGNSFWIGTGLILALLLGVGGWEIWGELSSVRKHAEQFIKYNEEIKGKSRDSNLLPSNAEIQCWKGLYEGFEKDFSAIQVKLAAEEEFEDLYFESGLREEVRAKEAVLPKDLDVSVNMARAAEHWFFQGSKHNVPARAFDDQGFKAAHTTAIGQLQGRIETLNEGSEGKLSLPSLSDAAGADVAALILEVQKAYWSAYKLVQILMAFNEKNPRAGLKVESIDFVTPLGPGGSGAKPSAKEELAVRETAFYRTIPLNLRVQVDFTFLPALVEGILKPEAGKSIGAFRFRSLFDVGDLQPAGEEASKSHKTHKKGETPINRERVGSRVAVTMQLEWWDWEIRPLAEYRKD